MTTTHILGYPRIGEKRELKFALEKYWRGEIDQAALKQVGSQIRQKKLGIAKRSRIRLCDRG
ncbi:hypothetical protein WI666_06535 [Vibrio cholerae]